MRIPSESNLAARYEFRTTLDAISYERYLQQGWRRFGPVIFRPVCANCGECRSLRVPVATFRPNASQLSAWTRNATAVDFRIGTPSITTEKEALFARFHDYQHDVKAWPLSDQGLETFTANPFPTEEWRYTIDGCLVGLGYVDNLAQGLSAIYFVWEPGERSRSLGTFNVLRMIEVARQRGLPHVYLGYYVEGCRSLKYKARFRPNDIVIADGGWRRFLGW